MQTIRSIAHHGALRVSTHDMPDTYWSSRGIVRSRTLIERENHLAEIDVGRRNAECSPYKAS